VILEIIVILSNSPLVIKVLWNVLRWSTRKRESPPWTMMSPRSGSCASAWRSCCDTSRKVRVDK